MHQTALRNRVVYELSARHKWVRVEELALSMDVEIKSLIRVLNVLRVQEHVEADGAGRVRHVGPPTLA
jgi:predicted transcriptional regulator